MNHFKKIASRWKIIYRLVGGFIFIFIIIRLDFKNIFNIFQDVKIGYMLIAVVFSVVHFVFKASRWNSLLKLQKIHCPAYEAWKIYMSAVYIGLITPGRVGEMAKVFYLKNKYNTLPYGRILTSVLLDRFLDIILIFIFSLFGIAAYFPQYLLVISLSLVGILFFSAVFYFRKNFSNTFLNSIFTKLIPKSFKEELKFQVNEFILGCKDFKHREIVYPIMYLIIAYFFFYLQAYLICIGLNIHISILYLVVAFSTACLLSLLPISIAGIGIRDATLIVFFSRVNLTSEAAISFSVIYLCVFSVSALIGFFTYLGISFGKDNF